MARPPIARPGGADGSTSRKPGDPEPNRDGIERPTAGPRVTGVSPPAAGRPPGRPPDTPLRRGLKRLLRVSTWRAIRRGELPRELDPEGIAPATDRASRTAVDDSTADLLARLGRGFGVRSVQAARQRRPLTDLDEWRALTAAVRAIERRRRDREGEE